MSLDYQEDEVRRRDGGCPLCGAVGPFEGVRDVRKRMLNACGGCRLVFAASADLPTPAAEKQRYAAHRNGLEDAGYVAFLRQALEPARAFLTPDMRGLDFGCGHSPVLHLLLAEMSFRCENFDPFFFPDVPPAGVFDFVFATEVVEHFHRPAREWERMVSHLKVGGILVVMTAPWTELSAFRTWGYSSDATHVAFYHCQTLEWISKKLGLVVCENSNPRVWIWKRVR